MNNPAYIATEEMGIVVENTRLALEARFPGEWPVLNYQIGYVSELNQTLQQFARTKTYAEIKFPCFWFAQPFSMFRGESGWYASLTDMRAFIIMETGKNYKALERMEKVFKPVIYPIYNEWLIQLKKHPAFFVPQTSLLQHKIVDRFFWGEKQQTVITDIVDVREISGFDMKLNNNPNCDPVAKQQVIQQL